FAAYAVSLLARGADADVVTQLGFSALFTVLIGSWIGGIIRQSAERAQLIDELQETREQLATVNHERGALAERERLSRDIHDTLAQGFASIVTLLEAVDAELGTDGAAARRYVALARDTARENLAETRSLVTALHPAGLTGTSLVEALDRLVTRWQAETLVPASLTVSGVPRRLTPAAEVVLLRAGQEGLANVGKHAGAGRVDLQLEHRTESTLLRVCDDGLGFDPATAIGPADGLGYGLAGMRARAQEAGGSLRLRSAPGAGTTIEVEVR
nr:sensor histidine kinase [Geodermatophilaceae bacterium]